MEQKQVTHFMYTPFTGLGLYKGHRGSRWLRNRIQIFKQFVVPSLLAQTSQNFKLWISWRYEDRGDPQILELESFLKMLFEHSQDERRVVFTYGGVCFWDDKYPDDVAYTRLVDAVHNSLGDLHNYMGEAESIIMTIQPSDDCYRNDAVEEIQAAFTADSKLQAIGFRKGYVMDYKTGAIKEWNPTTIPPFFSIKFPRATFVDPRAHVVYTGPYKSHEYIAENLVWADTQSRGFIVGTHGENISTVFNHPFAGGDVKPDILSVFGLTNVPLLKIKSSWRKVLMRKLPHGWQRKLRYWLGERFYARVYNYLRS